MKRHCFLGKDRLGMPPLVSLKVAQLYHKFTQEEKQDGAFFEVSRLVPLAKGFPKSCRPVIWVKGHFSQE